LVVKTVTMLGVTFSTMGAKLVMAPLLRDNGRGIDLDLRRSRGLGDAPLLIRGILRADWHGSQRAHRDCRGGSHRRGGEPRGKS